MKLVKIIEKSIGHCGRLISSSKSRYRASHPESIVYFNACIFDEKANQVWWGDIDITEDKRKLNKIAEIYIKSFYVTPEDPFRTDFNKVTVKELKEDKNCIKFNL